MNTFATFGLYRNVGQILEDLSKYENLKPVQQLIQVYNEAKTKCNEKKKCARYPLIVLEGLDGSGKTSMSQKLAKEWGAQKWLTPPESIRFLRDYFDRNIELKSAYYSLGNYIAALEVSYQLNKKPVLLDRFWHSTTAYALAQAVANEPQRLKLPDAEDEIYKWPADLLKPQKVIFLNVSEQVRLERHSKRNANLVTTQEKLLKINKKFRQDIIQAYNNMREPKVDIVNGDGSFVKTIFLVNSIVQPLLPLRS
ncbi:UMP-CMP kinase 2, mitochondrial-like [Euwallacea fornicatus]|uniref:UMP-CMP kinase 2, mitochondrial-like n=1 Tax=Euwallacea fornicatus TaxID=995702 RepID=UPI00338F01F4